MYSFARVSCLLSMVGAIGWIAACGGDGTPSLAPTPDGGGTAEGGANRDGGEALDAGADAKVDTRPYCGNGVVDLFEQCDPGKDDTAHCEACQLREHTLDPAPGDSVAADPKVAAGAQGYMVMWLAKDGREVHVRAVDASGFPSGPERRIDTLEGIRYLADSLKLTATSDGFLASWLGSDDNPFSKLRLRKLNAAGEPQGERELSVTPTGSREIYDYDVTSLNFGGGFSVIHADGQRNLIRMPVSLEGIAAPTSAAPIVTLPALHYATRPAVATRSDGSTMLAWDEMSENSGAPYSQTLRVALVKEGQSVWSTSIPETKFRLVWPTVAPSKDGKTLVAWTDELSGDMKATWMSSDGTQSESFALDLSAGKTAPSIAYSTKDEFLVVGHGRGTILGQRFASNGTRIDAKPFDIVPFLDLRSVSRAQVAAGADGSFLVAYKEFTSPYKIQYRVLPPGFQPKE